MNKKGIITERYIVDLGDIKDVETSTFVDINKQLEVINKTYYIAVLRNKFDRADVVLCLVINARPGHSIKYLISIIPNRPFPTSIDNLFVSKSKALKFYNSITSENIETILKMNNNG